MHHGVGYHIHVYTDPLVVRVDFGGDTMNAFERKCDTNSMYESEDQMVSHPSHYQSDKGLEVIDVIEAFTSDLKGIEATDTGNILKYACRWNKKNGIQDLEKILWYTTHLINHLKEKESVLHA